MAVGEGKMDNKQSQETETTEHTQTAPDLNQYVVDALQEIFSKAEQNYDDLTKSFVCLKKEDLVKGMSVGSQSPPVVHSLQGTQTSGCPSHLQSTTSYTSNEMTSNEASNEAALENDPDWDSLPEEELGPGTSTEPFLTRSLSSDADGKIAKLDNFVDDEGDMSDEEEWISVTGCTVMPQLACYNMCTSTEAPTCEDVTTTCTSQSPLEVLQGDINTLPGEVLEEENDGGRLYPTVRRLNITTTLKTSSEISTSRQNQDPHTTQVADLACEVQPFQLDEDFDYDVVALTPKFDFIQKSLRLSPASQ